MRRRSVNRVALAAAVCAILNGGNAGAANTVPDIGPLPPVTPNPENMPTPARIALGQKLFFDNRISGSGNLNCGSCHLPDQGWTVPIPFSIANAGHVERRNSPTLINVGYNKNLIWDGRAPNLEKQALGSTTNPVHKGQDINKLMGILNADPEMVKMFEAAYGSKPNPDDFGKAMAVFQRHTIITADSAFDRYMKGDKQAMNESAVRGMELFKGKAACIACHNGPNFTDSNFYNVGLKRNPRFDEPELAEMLRFDAKRMKVENWEQIKDDPGRYLVTKDQADWGKFKTPTLRNVSESGPYMHDGRYERLEQVIDHFDRGGDGVQNQDPRIRPLQLSQQDKADLKAFLLALRGDLPKITMK